MHTDSSRSIVWIQKIFCLLMCWLFCIEMPVLTYGVSAICLDPNLFFMEADSRDPVVPVCHCHTPAIGILTNSTALYIIRCNCEQPTIFSSQRWFRRHYSHGISIEKANKNPKLSREPMQQPLTQHADQTPLPNQSGRVWKQSCSYL
jgi:hypothetical protein